jgi:uncharacterized RDD family membrane protein YckC
MDPPSHPWRICPNVPARSWRTAQVDKERTMARVEELMARGALPVDWSPATSRDYAGFWRRVGASLVDGLLFLPVGLIFGVALTGTGPELIAQLAWLVYAISFDAQGATLGKRALGIKVIDAAGYPPGFGRSATRHVLDVAYALLIVVGLNQAGGLLVVLGLIGLVDVLWMLWDEDRQTLHDKLAGTYVVHA